MIEKLQYGENEMKRKAQCFSATIAVKAQMLQIKDAMTQQPANACSTDRPQFSTQNRTLL